MALLLSFPPLVSKKTGVRWWQALSEEERPGRMYDFVDWRVLVIELAEEMRLAEIMGEPVGARARQIQRLLLVE